MKGVCTGLIFWVVLFGLSGCREQPQINTVTDEDAITLLLWEHLDFLQWDLQRLLSEDSTFGDMKTAVIPETPIVGELRKWYRQGLVSIPCSLPKHPFPQGHRGAFRPYALSEGATPPPLPPFDLQIEIQHDTARVSLTWCFEGALHLWYGPPGDTGVPDTFLAHDRKWFNDIFFRRVLLVRKGTVDDRHRGWVIVAHTAGKGHTYPSTTLRIDSVAITFLDSVVVEDTDTADGRIDRILCSGNVLQQRVVRDLFAWIPQDSFLTVPPYSCARVKLYGSPAGVARAFLHFDARENHHVRHPLTWNPGENAWEGSWFAPRFPSGMSRPVHVIFDLIADTTFTDNQAYDAILWFLPFRVSAS